MPTLMHNNFYGIPGAGDCDCFTITAVACCKVERIPVRIVVVGNTPKNPTHVYCEVLDGGRWVPFDLCSPFYGDTKKYRYLSIIKVK
jgi:transglutaminase-like putative cysteine protease